MILLAVDPGLRGCGCALFEDFALYRAAYVKSQQLTGRGPAAHKAMAAAVRLWVSQHTFTIDELALEFPQVYAQKAATIGDPNDLLDLAGVDGALAMLYPVPVSFYLPREWKGQVPKQIMAQRIMSKLLKEEVGNLQLSGAKTHNTVDSVGIGLFHKGRL